jgi:hypothetical protein
MVNVNVIDVCDDDFVDTEAFAQALTSGVTVAGPGLIPTVKSNGAFKAALVGAGGVIDNTLGTKLPVIVAGCAVTLVNEHVGPLQPPLKPVNV